MRYSISHLLIATLILAVVIGIGYPTLKFLLYDNVNFTYDRDQTIEYVETTTSGQTRRKLLDAIAQLSVWDDDKILIAEASLSNKGIHVELISTTFRQPETLDLRLTTGDTTTVNTYEIESTGTYYFYGTISLDDKIPNGAKINAIHFRVGKSKSNEYVFAKTPNGG